MPARSTTAAENVDRVAHQKPQHIRDLVARLAKENTSWGYTKLRDVIFTLGHEIGRTTVRRILAEDGI